MRRGGNRPGAVGLVALVAPLIAIGPWFRTEGVRGSGASVGRAAGSPEPARLERIGRLPLAQAEGIDVPGRFAYVAQGGGRALSVVDVAIRRDRPS
jgi:hypothetical protein